MGKNEVMILAGKVNAIGATRGFLVAREFSKDAIAFAATDLRIKLIPCRDEFENPVLIEAVSTTADSWGIRVTLFGRNGSPSAGVNNWDDAAIVCLINNAQTDFHSYAMGFVDEMGAQIMCHGQYRNAGEHFAGLTREICYDEKQLIVNGMDVAKMMIRSMFWIRTSKGKVVSKFELEGHGRAYFIEPFEDKDIGEKIELNIVQRFRR